MCEYRKHKHNASHYSFATFAPFIAFFCWWNFRCATVLKIYCTIRKNGSFVTYIYIPWLWHTVLWKMSRNKILGTQEKEEEKSQRFCAFVTSVSLLTSSTIFDTLKMRSHPGKYLEQWKWLNPTYLSRWNMWNIFHDRMRRCCLLLWYRNRRTKWREKNVANFSKVTMQKQKRMKGKICHLRLQCS